MPAISFSLMEKAVIDPILILRAPLPPLELGQAVRWTATIWQRLTLVNQSFMVIFDKRLVYYAYRCGLD